MQWLYNIIGGKDYTPGRYKTKFPAGKTSALLNITIIIDDVFERDETFDCTVVGAGLPDRVSLGVVRKTTVIITDVGESNVVIICDYCDVIHHNYHIILFYW